MKYDTEFRIGDRLIAFDQPVYYIADIASSHDGELSRAKELIWLAKEAGADCAKFQHFPRERYCLRFGVSVAWWPACASGRLETVSLRGVRDLSNAARLDDRVGQ